MWLFALASFLAHCAFCASRFFEIPADETHAAEPSSTCSTHENATATFFCAGTDPHQMTACGNKYDPKYPGVAISTLLVPNFEKRMMHMPTRLITSVD